MHFFVLLLFCIAPDYDNRAYFNRILRKLHDQRFVEFNQAMGEVELLPPGYDDVVKILNKLS